DVNAVRAGGGETIGEPRLAMIEAGVEAIGPDRIAALVGTAGDADDARTLKLGDLPDDRTDRAGRRRDHHGLARLHLPDLLQADIGGEAGHAEDTEAFRGVRHVTEGREPTTVR